MFNNIFLNNKMLKEQFEINQEKQTFPIFKLHSLLINKKVKPLKKNVLLKKQYQDNNIENQKT